MSANNRQNQGQGRGIPENYERADDRIANFRKDYPGILGRIESIPMHNGDWCAFEARIFCADPGSSGDLVLIANAHAYDKWGAPSQAEKTEKAAIGRALVMAGYAALRGSSAEEIERNDEQERNGAPSAPTPLRRNTAQTSQNRPTTNETPAQDSRTTTRQESPATANATRVPWSEIDRADYRPSYALIVDNAWDLFEEDRSADEIKAHFAAHRKPMTDAEYADAQYRLGEILKAIRAQDEAVAEMVPVPASPPASRQEVIDRAVKPAKKGDPSIDDIDF